MEQLRYPVVQGRGKRLFQNGAAGCEVAAFQAFLEGGRRQGAKDAGILPRISAEGKNQRSQFAHEAGHAGAGRKPCLQLAAPAPGQRRACAAGTQGRRQTADSRDGGHDDGAFPGSVRTVAEQPQARAQGRDTGVLGTGARGGKDQTAGAQILFRAGAGMEADGLVAEQGAAFVVFRFPQVENMDDGGRAGQQAGDLAAADAAEARHEADAVAQGKEKGVGWSVHVEFR